MVNISVSPLSSFVDEQLMIRISGIQRTSRVTVRAFVDERDRKFESHAHFVSNGRVVLLHEQPSFGGSYKGVIPMGLFSHMQPSPGQKRTGIRLIKKDVTMPLVFDLTVYQGFLSTEDFYGQTNTSPIVLAKTTIERWYMSKDVDRFHVKSGSIRGTLFKPKGDGPFPGIIDMFGSAGGIMEFRSALFASYGYVCLCLAFVSYDDLPKEMTKVDMLYFEEAVDWLLDEPYVVDAGIGVISVSTGAQTALMMSIISGPKIKACVSINGCPYHTIFGPSRLYKGLVKSTLMLDADKAAMKGDVVHLRDMWLSGSLEMNKGALMKLEKAACEFLFVVGEDDQNWPSKQFATIACDYLADHGKKNWKILSYPGAGHLIEPHFSPLCSTCFQANLGYAYFYGGFPDEHAAAQEDSWTKIISFFKKNLDINDRVKRLPSVDYPPMYIESKL